MWIGRILLLGVGSSYLPRWVLSPLRHRDYVAGRLKALRKTTRWRQPNKGIRRGQGDEAKDRARQHGPVVVEAEGNDGLKFEDLDRAIGLRRWIHGLGSPLRVKDVIGLAGQKPTRRSTGWLQGQQEENEQTLETNSVQRATPVSVQNLNSSLNHAAAIQE